MTRTGPYRDLPAEVIIGKPGEEREVLPDDLVPRPPGCQCCLEEGDSPCPVHGDGEPASYFDQKQAEDPKTTTRERAHKIITAWQLLPADSTPWSALEQDFADALDAARAEGMREAAGICDQAREDAGSARERAAAQVCADRIRARITEGP